MKHFHRKIIYKVSINYDSHSEVDHSRDFTISIYTKSDHGSRITEADYI